MPDTSVAVPLSCGAPSRGRGCGRLERAVEVVDRRQQLLRELRRCLAPGRPPPRAWRACGSSRSRRGCAGPARGTRRPSRPWRRAPRGRARAGARDRSRASCAWSSVAAAGPAGVGAPGSPAGAVGRPPAGTDGFGGALRRPLLSCHADPSRASAMFGSRVITSHPRLRRRRHPPRRRRRWSTPRRQPSPSGELAAACSWARWYIASETLWNAVCSVSVLALISAASSLVSDSRTVLDRRLDLLLGARVDRVTQILELALGLVGGVLAVVTGLGELALPAVVLGVRLGVRSPSA